MAARIFISYRRKEDGAGAGRVHDRLEREFGSDLLFMDVDAIPLGANFVRVLRDAVSTCDALLAVIGPNWLDAVDDDGNRKLDNPDDFVRVEVGIALARDIPVVPILLDGAKIPKAARLPDDLKELAFRSGLEVRHASFRADTDKLIKWVNSHTRKTQTKPETKIPVDVPVSNERLVKFIRSDGLQLLINPNVVLVVSKVIKPEATQLRLTDQDVLIREPVNDAARVLNEAGCGLVVFRGAINKIWINPSHVQDVAPGKGIQPTQTMITVGGRNVFVTEDVPTAKTMLYNRPRS